MTALPSSKIVTVFLDKIAFLYAASFNSDIQIT